MEKTEAEALKEILENILIPERLDSHPWASRLFVKEAVARNHELRGARPGRQLVAALHELFPRFMPGTPPRRGKRLDTRWGEFGLLAALYFAPSRFGAPAPSSLRDAWGRIDQAILLYVDGHESPVLSERQIETYRLVSQEPEVAPVSTLSDWHRKGIQHLSTAIHVREKYLEKNPLAWQQPVKRKATRAQRALLLSLAAVIIILLGAGAYKGRQIYRLAGAFYSDVSALRGVAASPLNMRSLTGSRPLLLKSKEDFEAFYSEVEPLLWLGPQLGWVPVYGGDLAASREILQMADLLLESADTAIAASQPIMAMLESEAALDPSQLVLALSQAEPELVKARGALDQAMQLRAGLDVDRLSPRTRALVAEDLDRLLPVMDEGLAVATALPHILGATSEGPKTYLLLAQNEDELRPTGGFITAAGTLVVQNGQLLHLEFVDSGELENWDMPYPQAPWQLEQYMNSPVLVLRDASWFPDFPTAALYAESLYAYSSSHSVDGVIAFDQHLLVLLLDALGPLEVQDAPALIDAGNVIPYMRSAKIRPPDEPGSSDWTRKSFMDAIARAMLLKIFQGEAVSWQRLGEALVQGLNQEHLLLQLDDPGMAPLISRHGWDGAVSYQGGDFLMAVDSNIGFNKTNAVVASSLAYDVDLTDPGHPTGTLTVTHQNNAASGVECVHWGAVRPESERAYPINACYWNYLRVYVPAGAELLDATPQSVPNAWMLLDRGVAGPVDVLENELDGLQGFGALMVVPGGEALISSFQYRLPAHILLTYDDRTSYRLKVEKQPGTGAIPLIVRVHLPNGAALAAPVPGAVLDGNHLYFETNLRTDIILEIDFLLE